MSSEKRTRALGSPVFSSFEHIRSLPQEALEDAIGRQPSDKARILCFDDNGYYTFPSLHILEHIMSRTGTLIEGLEARPCEYFDLICGAGLGGVIALMLGRLGMTVGQCQSWFNEHRKNILPVGQANMVVGTGRKLQRNNDELEKAFKAALKTVGLPEDIPLLDPNHTGFGGSANGTPTCRVFVLAMHPGEIHIPIRLRSYSSRMDPLVTDCCLWEAAVATEASPTYYAPITMGKPPMTYISSGLGYCNPSREALDEAVRIWQVPGIRCLVSLGTGKQPPRLELEDIPTSSMGLLHLGKGLGMIHTLSAIATDTQRVHHEMTRDANLLGFKYFRFEGLDGVSYKDSYNTSFLEKVQSSVYRYVQSEEASKSLTFCAEHLQSSVPRYLTNAPDISRVPTESIDLSIKNEPRHQPTLSIKSAPELRDPEMDSEFRILDSEHIPVLKEKAQSELSADAWLERLKKKVHPLVQQRRRDNDRRVKIAVLDSGLDIFHSDILRLANSNGPDAENRIKATKDWTSSSSGSNDTIGHGTFCTALLLEVAPNADVYVGKVFDSGIATIDTANYVADAIEHAATVWEVDVIAMAFGFQQRQEPVMKAIRVAFDKGVIMLAAASNDGALESAPAFPARLDQVLCVYSADGYGASSLFNPLPSIAEDNFTILGERVASAKLEGERVRKSGTSVATMVAAGVAALVLELSFQRPSRLRESDIRSYAGMRAVFAAMSRDVATFSPDGRYFIRPWKLLDPEKDLEYVLMNISYILDRL